MEKDPSSEMKKPVPPEFKQNVYEYRDKGKDKSRTADEDTSRRHIVKDYVKHDVYLVDKHGSRFKQNLLANSLTAKLKQNVPGELSVRKNIMNKLRRESLKDFVHLDNLTKQYGSEMQWQSNRLDNEGSLLIRRQETMKKQSEMQRKNQEKIRSQIRKPSITQPDDSMFPNITKSSHSSSAMGMRTKTQGHQSAPLLRNVDGITFPSYPIDTTDSSHVKVFKYHGIFQPHNKYTDKRSRGGRESAGILKRNGDTPEYQILTLDINEQGLGVSTTQKKRKGLRVSWSGVERDMRDALLDDHLEETRTEGASTPNTVKSVKSDSAVLLRQSKRSRMEKIGLKWKLPPGEKVSEQRVVRSASSGKISKTLIPVSAGLNKTGMSETKIKWAVPQGNSLTTYNMYKEWLKKLDRVKAPPSEPRPFLQDILPHQFSSGKEVSYRPVPDVTELSSYDLSSNMFNVA